MRKQSESRLDEMSAVAAPVSCELPMICPRYWGVFGIWGFTYGEIENGKRALKWSECSERLGGAGPCQPAGKKCWLDSDRESRTLPAPETSGKAQLQVGWNVAATALRQRPKSLSNPRFWTILDSLFNACWRSLREIPLLSANFAGLAPTLLQQTPPLSPPGVGDPDAGGKKGGGWWTSLRGLGPLRLHTTRCNVVDFNQRATKTSKPPEHTPLQVKSKGGQKGESQLGSLDLACDDTVKMREILKMIRQKNL